MRRLLAAVLRGIAALLLLALVLPLLAFVVVPSFLDHVYHEGPVSGHFDGERFFNPDGEPIPGLSGPRGGVLTRFIPGGETRPPWPDHVAVTPVDPRRLPPLGPGEMRAIWVGHATVLVQTQGLNILTDPIWNDVAGPFGIGPRRVTAPGVPFDALPRIDVVVVSHNHYDHLDLQTLKRLWDRDRPAIVTPLGNERIMATAGVRARALDWGQALTARGATVHVVRVHHWSSRWLTDRNRALWSGFVISTGAGNIFFAGDTGPGDMLWPQEARAFGPVRLGIVPIGAFRFVPGQMVAGAHVGPREAVEVVEKLGAAAAIPVHWGTFRLSAEAWGTAPGLYRLFLGCRGLDPARFGVVRPGEVRMIPAAPASPGPARVPAAACRAGSPEISAFP